MLGPKALRSIIPPVVISTVSLTVGYQLYKSTTDMRKSNPPPKDLGPTPPPSYNSDLLRVCRGSR